MKKIKLTKKQIIIVISMLIAALIGGITLYTIHFRNVFTKPEFVKEVCIQNTSFNQLLDKFLDQVASYDGTKESTEKLEKTANKFEKFIQALKEKLGPKVPNECKKYYENMMNAYDMYLQSIDMYKKAVPKNLSEERTTLMQQAEQKLKEAQSAMKNLE